ncbi:DnaD domain protein [Bacillus sp. FJAT-52991]|uniref:DnaD domain protein n=1 Tax=Bacillus kandeliae TaxID=3129297 RepID=A0ABZ2NA78_9BACI
MGSKLLLDERPLLVLPSLATKIGLNEALFLQQLNYWINSSNHIHEEKKWVYNTIAKWQEQFPFWSESTLKRIIKNLEKLNLLVTGNFNKSPIDKTKWYSIDFDVLEKLSEVPEEDQEKTHNDALGQNEPMDSQNDLSSGQSDLSSGSEWSIEGVNLTKAIPESTTESTSIKEVEEDAPAPNPFSFFEQNGFGTIGGHIAQKISAWCEDLSDELVLYAMTLAVEQGKCTWSYTEAILKDWHQKKFRSVDQVNAARLAYKQQQTQKKQSRKSYSGKPIREERTPAWLKVQEDQQVPDASFESDKAKLEADAEFEKKRAELEARIKRSREGRSRE